MRRVALTLLALALLVVPAAPASASTGRQVKHARDEVTQARALVSQALAEVKAGDRARAYRHARAAYLDHFEVVEIPLRLRDASVVLDVEFAFAQLRNDIRDGEPVDQVRHDVRDVRALLTDVDRLLASKGLAAPALAFGFSFSILFREGVEAVLLIALLLGSLAAGSA